MRAVAFEAHRIARFDEIRIVRGAVDIVAVKASHAAGVHSAADEIVSLHAIFVGGAIREIGEGGLAELVFFERPYFAEAMTRFKADWPIIEFSGDGIDFGPTLRMA